jgi:hypothetical protein
MTQTLYAHMNKIKIKKINIWYNSAENLSGPGLFFFEKLFVAISISLHVIDLFRWLISSWFSFGW